MKDNNFYLLTGAAGFLGSLICKQLVQRGEKVRAFVLPNDKAAKYIPQGVEQCEGDLLDKTALERFFDVSEEYKIKVIHCASIVTVNPEFN
ncbi:MAG: NAD(P)-dependent oxidoreductase [Bacteroidales bacterium]|nr:NAD(P)-dependent oxidoreductase [Bacteroidales bacterium]